MKHLILLLALALPAAAQTLTNTDLDGVTNATINGKLDDDAAATHTALSLGTAATAATGDFADDGAVFYAARYGVLADGTTNDTVALQAAIDAASAVATSTLRATVVLPRGLIRLGRRADFVGPETNKQSITLKSNVNLVGQGIGATVLKLLDAVTSNCPTLLGLSGIANVSISDLTVDGNAVTRLGAVAGGEDEGINFKEGSNLQVRNCRIINCGQDGIDLDANSDVTIINCIFESNYGNGIHAVGGGPVRVKVMGCHFLSNGFLRRAADGLSGSGAGIDSIADKIIVTGCTFSDNVVEVQCYGGKMYISNSTFDHGGGGATLSAVVASCATSDSTLAVEGCQLYSSVASVIEVINDHPLTLIRNNRIIGTTTITSAEKVIYTGNSFIGIYGVHLVLTTSPAQICNNYFEHGYSNGLRIEASANGLASGNYFASASAVADIQLRAGSTGWQIIGNKFSSASTGIVSVSGGGGTAKIFGNTGGFDISLGATNGIIKWNELDAVALQSGGATGNVFEGNTISGAITHTTVTFASNTWRRNTGAGCAGIFYGTATLASGTATITTAAANSARKWSLSRQAPNASTAIGNLALGNVTAQTSFVINALDASAATATGDLSTVYWEILE